MKAIIACGSRDWTDAALIYDTLAEIDPRPETFSVIEGDCRGADRIAGGWAKRRVAQGVHHVPMPADWKRYGRGAGPRRNAAMLMTLLNFQASGATIEVIGFHDSIEGSGTEDMIERAQKAGVPWRLISHDDDYAAQLSAEIARQNRERTAPYTPLPGFRREEKA